MTSALDSSLIEGETVRPDMRSTRLPIPAFAPCQVWQPQDSGTKGRGNIRPLIFCDNLHP